MKTIQLNNDLINLELIVDDNNKMYLSNLIFNNTSYFSYEGNHRFIELEYLEGNHMGDNCSKFSNTPTGDELEYVSHEIKSLDRGSELILINKSSNFMITTHIVAYNGVKGFSIYNEVKNISQNNLTLENVSSFYMNGIGNDSDPYSRDMYIHKCSNSWQVETQWMRKSYLEEGIFNGNKMKSMKRHMISNVGSWSTKDYLPMAIIENAKENTFLLGQVENNGSWNIEIADDKKDKSYVSFGGPNYIDSHWNLVLKPNETFRGVTAAITLGNSFEEVIQEITKYRRHIVRNSQDMQDLPVIFNDYMHALWDTQTEALIWPLVDMASDLGCEEFVIDAGWFAKGCGWTNFIGEWKEYEDNFPSGGLRGTIDYIHSKGMKAGIWVEIENMGTKCPLCNKLPDSWFFMHNGKRVFRNTRNCLNLDNPEVYKWAMDIVSGLVEKYNLDYIKNDYNLDAGVGNDFGYDSMGDGLLRHNRAMVRWINELLERFPNITIENCGSGGCRMDYQMLSCCALQSTSDQTDYRKYPYLSSSTLTACIPEQCAVWSYPLNKQIKEVPTDEVVAMNMVNAMLGRIHLASYINELTTKQIELVKEGIRYFKQTREFKKDSLPIFPNGISYFFDESVAGGIIKGKDILLCVWNTSGQSQKVKVDLRKYDISEIKLSYPMNLNTKYEMNEGILTVDVDAPYYGRCFEIKLR